MMQFRRGFMRLFGTPSMKPAPDGLTGGDAALLELLDLQLLRQEAKSADIAAGRVGAKDRGQPMIEARRAPAHPDLTVARTAMARFTAPIVALDTPARRSTPARPLAALARLERADLLCGFGAKLQDEDLLKLALQDAAAAA